MTKNGIERQKAKLKAIQEEISVMENVQKICGEIPDHVQIWKDHDLVSFDNVSLKKVREIIDKLKQQFEFKPFVLKFAGSESIETFSPFALSVDSYKHNAHEFDAKLKFTIVTKEGKDLQFWMKVTEEFKKLPIDRIDKGDKKWVSDRKGGGYYAPEYQGSFPAKSEGVYAMNYAGPSIVYYCKVEEYREEFEHYVLNAEFPE